MTHRMKIKVYYEDTDAGGVVYYARYLGYLERGRVELLAGYGVDVAECHRNGIFFVVVRVDIQYKRPGRLGDVVELTTEVTGRRNVSMTLKQKIYRGNTLLIEADVTIACTDKDGRPQRLPERLREISLA